MWALVVKVAGAMDEGVLQDPAGLVAELEGDWGAEEGVSGDDLIIW